MDDNNNNNNNTKLPSQPNTKRLLQEWNWVTEHSDNFLVQQVNNNIAHWRIRIKGSPGTPYEGGYFWFELIVPSSFPFKPPIVRFLTPIFHPNIFQTDVSVAKLGSHWSPETTLLSVIDNIQTHLAHPSLDVPLNSEAASLYQNDHLQYEQTARLWTQRYAKFENFEYSTLNNDSTESSTSSLLLLTDRSCEGPIMSLSDDILVAHILTRSYRKAIHLITHLSLVCKKWYRLVKSHILWRCIDPGIEFERYLDNESFWKFLEKFPAQKLTLRHGACPISVEGLKSLRPNSIRVLKISNDGLSIEVICSLLLQQAASLQNLSFTMASGVTFEQLNKDLGIALSKLSHLRKLSLNGIFAHVIGPKENVTKNAIVDAFFKQLPVSHPQLISLDLSSSLVGDEHLQYVLPQLGNNLKKLDIGMTWTTSASLRLILSNCKKLVSLGLAALNGLQNSDIERITAQLPHLTSLDLSCNKTLTEVNITHSCLEVLNLNSCKGLSAKNIKLYCPKLRTLIFTQWSAVDRPRSPEESTFLRTLYSNKNVVLAKYDERADIRDEKGVFPVRVRLLSGRIFRTVCPSNNPTVGDLKKCIEEYENVRPEDQRLIFQGKRLEDGRLLTDYNATHDSLFHLVLRLR